MPITPANDNATTNIQLNFRSFEAQVLYFNGMYKLPAPPLPTVHAVITDERRKLLIAADNLVEEDDIKHASGPTLLAYRLKAFKHTILKEVEEVEDIIKKLADLHNSPVGEDAYTVEDLLTELADWLGDIQVYCASEMAKFGLPIKDILTLIMQSNFSKLQLDGSVKYDEHGKVEKGPMYWKPEPSIKQLLIELAKG